VESLGVTGQRKLAGELVWEGASVSVHGFRSRLNCLPEEDGRLEEQATIQNLFGLSTVRFRFVASTKLPSSIPSPRHHFGHQAPDGSVLQTTQARPFACHGELSGTLPGASSGIRFWPGALLVDIRMKISY